MSCKVDLHEACVRLKFLGDAIMYLGKQECYWRDTRISAVNLSTF